MDVIIETPKGSQQKYAYDENLKLFRFKKVLAAGLHFPFDFGFIPATKGEDGNPLDIMVISEYQVFPGCVMDVRIVGCLQATESIGKTHVRNDRFIGIAEQSTQYDRITSLEQLPAELLDQIKRFYTTYLQAEGKQVNWEADLNALQAVEKIKIE